MPTSQKITAVKQLAEEFQSSSSMIIVHYHGLTVSDVTKLRRQMRGAGVDFKVVKNRLTKIAIRDTEFECVESMLSGPTAIALSKEPVVAAKTVVEFAKANPSMKIVGGVFDGKVLSVSEVQMLSKLPSQNELRAQIIGLLNAPASKLVGVLQAPAAQLARVTRAYSEK